MEEGPFELLLTSPFGYLLAAVWGALWGSFFNVAIDRLAREDASLRSLLRPPSHCPACKTPIRARDNVPILGWLLLRGRCRSCGAPISARYPLVELLGLIVALAVYREFFLAVPGPAPLMLSRFFAYFFFVGTLLVLAFIDLDTMLLPEAITIPAIPAFFLAGLVIQDVPWWDALIGLAVGFGGLKALELGYLALTGRPGLGGGDAMLMALIGGFLGWRAVPITLGLGATFGSLVSIPLLLLQRRSDAAVQQTDDASQQAAAPSERTEEEADGAAGDVPLRHVEVPFGPFLVAAALCYLFFGRAVRVWLLGYVDQP